LNLSSGKIWPYAISISILFIFGACVATIIVANKLPVEKSDTYMMGYHEADSKVNDIIEDAISFNNKYNIEYITDSLSQESSIIKYKITNISGDAVNNAEVKVIITRPNNHKHNQELNNPKVDNGIYSFDTVTLPKAGRWDIMAKVNIEDNQRYFNVKADTRAKEAYEY